jgi:hypothetical protein
MSIDAYMHEVSRNSEPGLGNKMNLIHVQSYWNEIITSIACHAVEMANNFVSLPCGEVHQSVGKKPTQLGKNFKLEDHNSNDDRIRHFFDQFGVVEVVMQMATLSYRKACRLKMLKAQKDGENDLATDTSQAVNVIVVDNDDSNNATRYVN